MCCGSAGVVWVAYACEGRLGGKFGAPRARWWRPDTILSARTQILEDSLLTCTHRPVALRRVNKPCMASQRSTARSAAETRGVDDHPRLPAHSLHQPSSPCTVTLNSATGLSRCRNGVRWCILLQAGRSKGG